VAYFLFIYLFIYLKSATELPVYKTAKIHGVQNWKPKTVRKEMIGKSDNSEAVPKNRQRWS